MEPIKNNLPLEQIRPSALSQTAYDDPEQALCNAMNAGAGNKAGYDCPICKNKGVNYRISSTTGSIVAVPCQCETIRQARSSAQKSGLGDLLERCALDTYRADHPWQQRALQTAKVFLAEPDGNWLYVGGQVGAGKTHLCAAITGELLHRGFRAQYSLWRAEAQYLRSHPNETEYKKRIDELAKVPVLYIDDFLKIENGEYQRPRNEGNASPSGAETRTAFELISARYNSRSTITIFSSEHFLSDLHKFDTGLSSRIAERCQNGRFLVEIERSGDRNMRYSV